MCGIMTPNILKMIDAALPTIIKLLIEVEGRGGFEAMYNSFKFEVIEGAADIVEGKISTSGGGFTHFDLSGYSEAAEFMGYSVSSVKNLISQGVLMENFHYKRVSPRRILFSKKRLSIFRKKGKKA